MMESSAGVSLEAMLFAIAALSLISWSADGVVEPIDDDDGVRPCVGG